MTRNDIPTSYEEAMKFLGDKDSRTVCNNTTVERDWKLASGKPCCWRKKWEGIATIRLHGFPVVEFYEYGTIRLQAGKYKTATTKDRMNRCLGSRGRVYQHKYEWFYSDGIADQNANTDIPFHDGMTV